MGFEAAQAVELSGHHALRAFLALTPGGAVGDLHIATVGEWSGHPNGSFALGEADIDHVIARFESQRNPMMVDYDHKSLNFSGTPSDGLAAGWIQSLEKRHGESGAELWAKVEWCAPAADAIRRGEYRYCSPVFEWDATDRKTGEVVEGVELFNVAVTNQPFLDGNHPIQLTRVRASVLGESATNLPKEKQPMFPTFPPKKEDAPAMAAPQSAPPGAPPFGQPQEQKPGEPKPPEQKPAAATQAPLESAPKPAEPLAPAVAPEKNVEDAQLTTAIDALMRVMQVDRPAVVAALGEYADAIGSMLNQRLERDGTPAEMRSMSSKPPDGAPASGGAPPVADDAKRIEAIERKQSEAQLVALKAKLDELEAKEKARTEGETASRRKGVELHVKRLIDTGYVRDEDREDALYMFEHHPERAERIWAKQLVPIGTTQAGPNASAPAAPSAAKVVDFEKATESDLLPHERSVFESHVIALGDRKRALTVVLSNRDMIARHARQLGMVG